MVSSKLSIALPLKTFERERHFEAIVEGVGDILSQTVAQARTDDATDVFLRDFIPSFESDKRLGRARHDDVATQTVDVDQRADARNLQRQIAVHLHGGQELLRGDNLRLQRLRLFLALLDVTLRVALVR